MARCRRLAAAALLVILVACGGGNGARGGSGEGDGDAGADGGGASGQLSPSSTEEPVAAAVLAAMDERSNRIGEYRDLLDTLQPLCQEAPNRIADFAVDAQRRMSDHGRTESMATILRAMIAAIPDGSPPTSCAAVAIGVANRLAP